VSRSQRALAKHKVMSRKAIAERSVEQTCEPTNRNRIQGAVNQGERAMDREALATKEPRRRSGGCAEKVTESYLGRSRLTPERVTQQRSEKSAEAVVARRRGPIPEESRSSRPSYTRLRRRRPRRPPPGKRQLAEAALAAEAAATRTAPRLPPGPNWRVRQGRAPHRSGAGSRLRRFASRRVR
jgi:hypothetical protein